MWTKPEGFGGQIGEIGGTSANMATIYEGNPSYIDKFQPVIMQGILYYTEYPSAINNPTGIVAVDLRTGETLWTDPITDSTNNFTELRCGQILTYNTFNEEGSYAYLWTISGPTMTALAPVVTTEYSMLDAATGKCILNIVDCPSASASGLFVIWTQDQSGNLIQYLTNATTHTLIMWNATKAIVDNAITSLASSQSTAAGTQVGAWWPPEGVNIPWSTGIEWSVPVVMNVSGEPLWETPDIYFTDGNVLVLQETEPYGFGFAGSFGTPNGLCWVIDEGYSAATGQLLWGPDNRTNADWYYDQDMETFTCGDGVYALYSWASTTWTGYSLATGQQLWVSGVVPTNIWSDMGCCSATAYGCAYVWDFGGNVYCMNMTNGNIVWTWNTGSSGINTPYGIYPFWINAALGSVADGMFYIQSGHGGPAPMDSGDQLYCLNATTGKLLWSILLFGDMAPPAIADGEMTVFNSYDNQIYAFGVGPTKTTVNAPDVGVTTNTPITITGTVMDISAGSQQNAVAANFPNGLPCVSDASMSQFMEAVYMQQPMPTNITGVPVTLTETDHNGNTYVMGTTTTNAYGSYGFNWTPPIEGNYTIVATFGGSAAYYGSCAETYLYASSPAATAAPTASPPTGLASTGTVMLGVAVLAIIIIVCVAVLAILLLRKHP